MARSSRHKSHRSHKHRDRSDSEEEQSNYNSGSKKQDSESRVSESEKRKQGKDPMEESLKKRKDRGEGVVSDRWNGGEEERKKAAPAVVVVAVDSKGKAVEEDRRKSSGGGREEKRRSAEKESGGSSRKESGGGGGKDGGKSEREKDYKKVGPESKERSLVNKDLDNSEWRLHEELRNPELEKELEKRMKKRKDSNEKLPSDGRDIDDRRMSSRDEHSRNGSCKDERHKDERDREKHSEGLERNKRHHDDKHRDEHSSRVHASDKSDNKIARDENRSSENRYRKTKIQDCDHDGTTHDGHGTKFKDNKGRKRTSDEIEDRSDVKPRSAKEPREDTEKNGSSSSKFDSRSDRPRLEHPYLAKVDSSLSSSQRKISPSSSAYAVKDESRHGSKQAESTRRDLLSEEIRRPSTASRDRGNASGGRERLSESRSLEKTKPKDDIRSDEYLEIVAVSHYDRNTKTEGHTSSNKLIGKSSSTTSDRRPERNCARRNHEMEEVGQRSNITKDGRDSFSTKDSGRERELAVEKPKLDDTSRAEVFNNEPIPVGTSSNRSGHLQGSSPGNLPPPPPVRHGVDSPSVLGSYEDENRIPNGDRKGNSRYKRSGDLSMGRGQGTPWKNTPSWPSPAANGFIPQHGPPTAGFHPSVQQFPASPLFGVRPSMDLGHPGAPYHLHEAANRFPGHARPYGWHNPVDDCSHLQVWDGGNNVFSDDSHMYARSEWDQNRHLMGNRGWGMNADMRKGQNGNANLEFPIPQKQQEYSAQALADEVWVGQSQSGHRSHDERARSERPTAENSGIKHLNNTFLPNNSVGAPAKSLREKTPGSTKIPSVNEISERPADESVPFCCIYLSRLDLSLDLIPSELHEQCKSLMARDEIIAGNGSMQGCEKNNKGDKVATKSKKLSLSSFFPVARDDTFQRAMSLYKISKERVKEEMHPALPLVPFEQGGDPPVASSGEKVNTNFAKNIEEDPIDPSSSDGEKLNTNSTENMEENPSLANADSDEDMEEQPPVAVANSAKVEEDSPMANAIFSDYMEEGNDTNAEDVLGNTEEHKFDNNSGAVLFVEGSEESEALLPECRVNLSRIHLPPESTH